MKNIGIMKDNFLSCERLSKVLSQRDFNVVELPLYNSVSIDTLILSAAKEIEMGGRQSVVEFARGNKASNILIIEERSKNFKTITEFGGKLNKVCLPESEETIDWGIEVSAQIVSDKNSVMVKDKKSRELLNLAKRVADTNVTVFINGPTGTGKEVISNYIHNHSRRSENAFVAVNCAAIPENMLEAILFGHEKGSFTGASHANKGIFRAADNGTLLLDEISEMPLSLQAKLLRVLQEKKVTPVGGNREVEVNVRIVATTNRNMLEEVKNNNFREDLYYRLNVFPIKTFGLNKRKEDIIPLVVSIIKKNNKKENEFPYLSKLAQDTLIKHNWSGNVRELENVILRSIVLSNSSNINEKHIIVDDNEQDHNEYYQQLEDKIFALGN